MEALIEDSIEYIISHEDPQRFIGWMCKHIDDYYTAYGAINGACTAIVVIECTAKALALGIGQVSRPPDPNAL